MPKKKKVYTTEEVIQMLKYIDDKLAVVVRLIKLNNANQNNPFIFKSKK